MSEPSGVRTRSQRRLSRGKSKPTQRWAIATSAAEQFEGERQPSAGGNDETLQSQSQAPGAEAPTTTSEEDKMQTLMRLLINMNQTLNQKMDQKAQAQASKPRHKPSKTRPASPGTSPASPGAGSKAGSASQGAGHETGSTIQSTGPIDQPTESVHRQRGQPAE